MQHSLGNKNEKFSCLENRGQNENLEAKVKFERGKLHG
jgi:hypothetical protein